MTTTIRNRKRRGGGLLLALVITLIGSALITMVFGMSASFLNTSMHQSRVYSDGIAAESFIEQAKGTIIAQNKVLASGDQPVLHAPANTLAKFGDENDKITSLTGTNGLLMSTADSPSGNRTVRVNVFDALYMPGRINLGASDLANLPPSFFIESGSSSGGMTATNPDGSSLSGEGGGYGTSSTGASSNLEEIHKKYGVYLVQVEILNQEGRWVRRTEEAFAHRIP